MSITIDLSGKVALVTGAGRGIGRAIALSLAQAGADVALAARTKSQIEETAALIEKTGRKALSVVTDVTNMSSVENAVAATLKNLGGLHILVNNAGARIGGDLLTMSEETWHMMMEVNVTGVFLCTKAAGKHMVAQKYGKIVNTASTGGFLAGPKQAAYHASKAAVINFTRAVAFDWARYNINVNAIAPGWIETELIEDLAADPEKLKGYLKSVPLRRLGRPAEIGPLVAFLCSDLAAYITGETVVIDGGLAIP